MLAHEALQHKREEWERDPFKLIEENGYFYARGATDDKAMASAFVDSMVRYRKSGFKPQREPFGGCNDAPACGRTRPGSPAPWST